jgi:hypothetical protein
MNHILFLPIHCIYQADLWLRQSSGRALLPVEMVCNHAVTKLKKHTNNTNKKYQESVISGSSNDQGCQPDFFLVNELNDMTLHIM